MISQQHRRTRRRTVGALVASSLALSLLAGCSEEAGPALSEDEFLKQANAICLEAREARIALPQPAEGVTDDYTEAVKEIQERATGQFRDLVPPEELQDDYEEFVGLAQQIADDPITAGEVFDRFVSLARSLGIEDCTQGTELDAPDLES